VRQFTRTIMLEIAALLPEHLRGEYANASNGSNGSGKPVEQDVSART
jgi:hypothetical protein